MANVKFSDFVELTTWGDDDLFMVTDDSESVSEKSKKIKGRTIEKRLIPPGMVAAFAMETAPPGWIECNGDAVSRTTYADLFSAIGTVHGVGNGTTTFNVPDYRGYFLRGFDHGAGNDPDAATRTDSGDGTTTGDHVGTKQADENKSHRHPVGGAKGAYGAIYRIPGGNASVYSGYDGGNEARPKNINVMYCVKY